MDDHYILWSCAKVASTLKKNHLIDRKDKLHQIAAIDSCPSVCVRSMDADNMAYVNCTHFMGLPEIIT